MGKFFNGWRREVGCVLLVMAAVFMGGWIRSEIAYDEVRISIGDHRPFLLSQKSSLYWGRWIDHARGSPSYGWRTFNLQATDEWGSGWSSSGSVAYSARPSQIPYWSITIPLTLLSACLILWKPRIRTGQGNG